MASLRSPNTNKLAVFALLTGVTLTLAACTNTGPVIPGAPTDIPVPPTVEQVKVFDVEAGSFYFRPNTITVKQGDRVRINLRSVDMQHDYDVDELGVDGPVTPGGQTSTVEFTATTSGTFESYCSVGQHRQNGMVGQLIVEE